MSCRRLPVRGWGVALMVALLAGEMPAQVPSGVRNEPASTAPVSRPTLEETSQLCSGEVISSIEIRSREPFVRGMLERWEAVSQTVNAVHVTTRPRVIRSFLLMQEGERCTEPLRTESERILRAQPFLAAAVVRAEAAGRGQVRLVVETVDEVALLGGIRAGSDPAVRMLRLGVDNLMGEALHVSAEWRAGTWGRDGFTARVMDYQLLGKPYQLMVEASREQIGGHVLASVTQPFYTDYQRAAWRASAGNAHELFEIRREGEDPLGIVLRREHADVGGVVRIGPPGRLALVGFALTHEQENVESTVRQFTPTTVEVTTEHPALLEPYAAVRSTRINALAGIRSIAFLQVSGFESLAALQDVRRGVQLGTMLGRSLPGMSGGDDDVFVGVDLYAGFGTPASFTMVNAKAEGRRDDEARDWDGVLASARMTHYARFAPRQTLVATLDWAAGWRARVPFQLLLGHLDGGVRGYARSDVGGAQRAVLRLENRWALGQFQELGGYGLALFADAGRTWSGDVPFGVDSPMKYGAGVSLLAAVPPGSQRLWRLDLAYPLSADTRAGLEVRLSSTNRSRTGWRETRDVERSRERTVPQAMFRWP